jgi:hypothetical protein
MNFTPFFRMLAGSFDDRGPSLGYRDGVMVVVVVAHENDVGRGFGLRQTY